MIWLVLRHLVKNLLTKKLQKRSDPDISINCFRHAKILTIQNIFND